jgi:hypothetical protein
MADEGMVFASSFLTSVYDSGDEIRIGDLLTAGSGRQASGHPKNADIANQAQTKRPTKDKLRPIRRAQPSKWLSIGRVLSQTIPAPSTAVRLSAITCDAGLFHLLPWDVVGLGGVVEAAAPAAALEAFR